jgi:glycosyltransferase involved in cell wall biosynthesis
MKLSVALCTFNGEKYLLEQLESISAQTRQPDEVVICDDRSSDKTVEIIGSFAEDTAVPVRLEINERTLGSTRNFEQAIRLCSGDVIALSDQDDIWLPEKLRQFEGIFARDPGVGLVFTDAELVDKDMKSLSSNLWDFTLSKKDRRAMEEGRAFEVLVQRYVVTGATMAFRSNFVDLILPIPVNSAFVHDAWIALVISAAAKVVALPKRLIKYRQHGKQQLGVTSLGRTCQDTTVAGRAEYYAGQVQKLNQFEQRVLNRNPTFGGRFCEIDSRLRFVNELRSHYQMRGNIPGKRWRRISHIAKELLTRRYHRFSKGTLSGLLDLLR